MRLLYLSIIETTKPKLISSDLKIFESVLAIFFSDNPET
jgi:hypothetical protein